ncbi:MAG: hypothetical protein ACP5P1_05170 [Acidimicrobiales bacterium]
MTGSLADIVERLHAISDELADLGLASMREALRGGDKRDPAERRLAQARRSVDKAAALLEALRRDDSGE